jgi:hypothetical protein
MYKKTVKFLKLKTKLQEQESPLEKPFRSQAQRRFAYANASKFGGKEGLKEWESATPKNIPEKVAKSEELDIGQKIEHEHRSTLTKIIKKLKPSISDEELEKFLKMGFKGIASEHIEEFEKYYTALTAMEAALSSMEKSELDDLEKGIGHAIKATAFALALTAGAHYMGQKPADPGRQPASMEQTAAPQANLDHKTTFLAAMQQAHDGGEGYSKTFGMSPTAIKYTVDKDPDLKQKYQKIANAQQTGVLGELDQNPVAERDIASKYYDKVNSEMGSNQLHNAHAWKFGIQATKKQLQQTPSLENHWYSKKVSKYLGNQE